MFEILGAANPVATKKMPLGKWKAYCTQKSCKNTYNTLFKTMDKEHAGQIGMSHNKGVGMEAPVAFL
eukprot:CAMPEP_0114545584 /NCGR_PEP_ID=MMETSP0114-20121206/3483_1 /TAXON_ID=31324 /ORGANISM="Goniomonas sp, Strain m" /LENGTH=66 /DNA_ID=CAMNT_0001730031 /DNA_START=144 /DNA_END=344 /DNA_ORIENTATION=-